MNSDTKTCFGLIRHAPTLWNEQKRIQGQQDSPLSDRGRELAEKWGKRLDDFGWDRLVCSDLARVIQTSELINKSLHLPVEVEPYLREQDWGKWSGKTLKEIKFNEGDQLTAQEQNGWKFKPPGGESRIDVLKRCLKVLHVFHTTWPGEKILVICHEGIIKCVLYHLLDRLFLPEEPKIIQSFQLHRLAIQDNTLAIDKINSFALNSTSESE